MSELSMQVIIPERVKAEIMHYVNQASPSECSGLGRVVKQENGDMLVSCVYLLDQVNTGVTTDLDATEVAKLQYTSRDDEGDLNFWWHSHVDMGVMWSGTDMATIEQFGKNGYLLATVFNKREQTRSAYYQGATDFLPPIFLDDLKTIHSYQPSAAESDVWTKNFDAKDKRPAYSGNKFGYYMQDYDYPKLKKPKKAKRKVGRPKKNTILTDEPIDFMRELDKKLNMADQEYWCELVAEHKGINQFSVNHEQLYNFCVAYNWNYDTACSETLMMMSHKEEAQ